MAQPPTATQQPTVSPPPPPAVDNSTPDLPQPTAHHPAPSQNPNPPPPDPVIPSQAKPRSLTRPWQPPQPSTGAAPPTQRGVGVAISVPTHHSGPPPPVPSTSSSASSSQVRPASIGTFVSSSQQRPSALSPHRPMQSPSFRMPASSVTHPQSSQGHHLLRGPSISSPASSSPSTSQPMPSPSLNQPWLSSTSQLKPSFSSPSFRQQLNPPSMQQRPHIPQQIHHPPSSTASQPTHHASPSQTQQPASNQPPDQYGTQFSSSKTAQLTPNQQSIRPVGAGPTRPPLIIQPQLAPAPSVRNGKSSISETEGSCNRILSKRSISEIVNQIDPSEKLDPEVEDILLDVAEEFIDSPKDRTSGRTLKQAYREKITTFSCSLAKHRKSTTLEAKDILLHLEKNWNITLPGFSCDEIKSYRKPVTNDVHKERMAAIKRSISLGDAVNNRNAPGQTMGAAKSSSLVKTPANFLGSPNLKN